MLASAFAFAASFAVISIACDYRYLYDLDLAVIAAALYATAGLGVPLAAVWARAATARSKVGSRKPAGAAGRGGRTFVLAMIAPPSLAARGPQAASVI